MSVETISSSELNKLMTIYEVYKQESHQDKTSFLQLSNWMEQKQITETIMERICQPGEIIIREDEGVVGWFV